MKITNKILCIILIVIFILFKTDISIANSITISEKIKEATPIKNSDIELTKKIKEINNEEKEIEIELTMKSINEKTIKGNTEILFLIDDSSSMSTKIKNTNYTRKVKVNESTEKIINKINQNNPNIKMGVMYFQTNISTINKFTTNVNEILQTVRNMKQRSPLGVTNMGTALVKAKESFSKDVENKIIILLTDGLPTDKAENTKKQLKDEKVYIISALVGMESIDQKTIASIFGTIQNPTADRLYNIADNDIETIISNNIYNRILNDFEATTVNVNIKDFFPENIVNNFEIKIEEVSKGNASLDDKDVINWEIEKLENSEEVKLTYKLKLKENFDEKILNKELNTNQYVELEYTNTLDKKENKIMRDSPQIILIAPEEKDNNDESNNSNKEEKMDVEPKKDDTDSQENNKEDNNDESNNSNKQEKMDIEPKKDDTDSQENKKDNSDNESDKGNEQEKMDVEPKKGGTDSQENNKEDNNDNKNDKDNKEEKMDVEPKKDDTENQKNSKEELRQEKQNKKNNDKKEVEQESLKKNKEVKQIARATANKEIPYTGKNSYIIIMMIITTIFAIRSIIKIRKIK